MRHPHALRPLTTSLDRWVDQVFRDFAPATAGNRVWPVDLWEEADALHLEMDVPGLALDQIEVEVHEGLLHLRAKPETTATTEDPETPERKWFRRERRPTQFERRFELPFDIEMEQVEATLRHGVLRVRLPKAAQAKPRKIDIKVVEN